MNTWRLLTWSLSQIDRQVGRQSPLLLPGSRIREPKTPKLCFLNLVVVFILRNRYEVKNQNFGPENRNLSVCVNPAAGMTVFSVTTKIQDSRAKSARTHQLLLSETNTDFYFANRYGSWEPKSWTWNLRVNICLALWIRKLHLVLLLCPFSRSLFYPFICISRQVDKQIDM